ncbi:hypothetical protein [Priestia megaterium]|uniref:hypothetical protein n=1 Tax=Priestia megaterium TaxID=1404 RepID=UPI001649F9DD|nr:hypothetical protein [Priestia megaterium]
MGCGEATDGEVGGFFIGEGIKTENADEVLGLVDGFGEKRKEIRVCEGLKDK